MNRLLTTAEASKITGISEYELRLGFKQGRYPAIQLGREGLGFRKLCWNLDAPEDAIMRQMQEMQKNDRKQRNLNEQAVA